MRDTGDASSRGSIRLISKAEKDNEGEPASPSRRATGAAGHHPLPLVGGEISPAEIFSTLEHARVQPQTSSRLPGSCSISSTPGGCDAALTLTKTLPVTGGLPHSQPAGIMEQSLKLWPEMPPAPVVRQAAPILGMHKLGSGLVTLAAGNSGIMFNSHAASGTSGHMEEQRTHVDGVLAMKSQFDRLTCHRPPTPREDFDDLEHAAWHLSPARRRASRFGTSIDNNMALSRLRSLDGKEVDTSLHRFTGPCVIQPGMLRHSRVESSPNAMCLSEQELPEKQWHMTLELSRNPGVSCPQAKLANEVAAAGHTAGDRFHSGGGPASAIQRQPGVQDALSSFMKGYAITG